MAIEEEVLNLIFAKHMELTAKGYSEEQASAAIKRARKWSESIARKVAPSSRDSTFLALFTTSLNESEAWLSKVKNTGKKWKEGMESFGVQVGPVTTASYERWSA